MCNFAANYTTSFLTVKSTPTMFEKASAWLHHASCHFSTFSGKKRSKGATGRRVENLSFEGKVNHCCQDRFQFISIRRTRTSPLTMRSVESHLLRDVVKGTPKSLGKSFSDMWCGLILAWRKMSWKAEWLANLHGFSFKASWSVQLMFSISFLFIAIAPSTSRSEAVPL